MLLRFANSIFSLYDGGVLWRVFLLLLSDFLRVSLHFIVCPYSSGLDPSFVTFHIRLEGGLSGRTVWVAAEYGGICAEDMDRRTGTG